MTSWRTCRGTRSSTGPSARMIAASVTRAPVVPSTAGRHPLRVATARMIVKASTISTREARNAEPMEGAAVVHSTMFQPPVRVMSILAPAG